jgi:hypothetical protein
VALFFRPDITKVDLSVEQEQIQQDRAAHTLTRAAG